MKDNTKTDSSIGDSAISESIKENGTAANLFEATTAMGSILGIFVLLFLYIISRYNFLLFHTIEVISKVPKVEKYFLEISHK